MALHPLSDSEHLEEKSSETFVDSLTSLSDVVMFSAAYETQGGTHHIDEQCHTYWAKKFMERGYMPSRLFRPAIRGNDDVDFWHQQNVFRYVKRTSAAVRL